MQYTNLLLFSASPYILCWRNDSFKQDTCTFKNKIKNKKVILKHDTFPWEAILICRQTLVECVRAGFRLVWRPWVFRRVTELWIEEQNRGGEMYEWSYVYHTKLPGAILTPGRGVGNSLSQNIFPRCEIKKELWANIIGLMDSKIYLENFRHISQFLLGNVQRFLNFDLECIFWWTAFSQVCVCQYLFQTRRQVIAFPSWVCAQSFSNCR